MTAPLNLDALQALCDAATPGEWVCDFPNIFRVEPKPPKGHCPTAIVEEYPNEGGGLVNEADGKFIAAAREAMPQLIAEVRQDKTRIQRLEDALIYARRFLNRRDHDVDFVDAALTRDK